MKNREIGVKKRHPTAGQDAYDRVSKQLNLAVRLLGFWIALVSLFFLFQALDYRGLIARLAEWQFLHFDRYWPTLTFVAVTALFSAPLIAAVWLLRTRQRRTESFGPARQDDLRIVKGRLARLQGFFAGVCVGSLLAAVIVLILRLQLPSDEGTPRSIVVGSPDAIAPVEGRAVITGSIDLRETAQFNEDLLLVKRSLYFAPVRSGPDDRSPLRYFVEVRRNDVPEGYHPITFPKDEDLVRVWRFRLSHLVFTPYLDGVLRREALPGEIVNLYRHAGYDVEDDNFVLFSGLDKLTWRYNVLAAEFGISALISGLAAFIFGRRRRQVKQRMEDEIEASRTAQAPA
ncbi:hypothetical protein [Sphingobium sp. B2D3C]|uniref:hypothetical protein n=1 Tax=Sphingobium sp. B2D3C TaxID=2940581 RepID=UPI0022248CF4|nr:hypothetical protein [Sphingobium sp. B2D3C]MCW2381610.1 hypothetical protein [Sphingobium sp. B2D3B]MCW2398283.1 hypothetical protein [Sphingobium sp. B2D3C]